MAIGTGITIEDFERLPAALAHNHELVDGELVEVSGNTDYHNALRDLLIALLLPIVNQGKLGKIRAEQEYDFGGNAHAPDISFISAAKLHLIERKRRVHRFVPDLAIEIASDNDTPKALLGKAVRYRQCGTQEVWILSPDTRHALVLSEAGEAFLRDHRMFESKLIPGFSIRLAELFDQA